MHQHAFARPAGMIAVMLALATSADAQRAPLVGTVSPNAIGPAVQQPAPIGGLRTTPLSAGRPAGTGVGTGVGAAIGAGVAYPYGYSRGVRVIDAPLPRGLASGEGYGDAPYDYAPRWMPSYQPPRWRPDSSAPASPMWRDLIVSDVVCSASGVCLDRTQRIRARWMARCDCYAFSDGWNRVWRVGERERRAAPAGVRKPIRIVRTDSGGGLVF